MKRAAIPFEVNIALNNISILTVAIVIAILKQEIMFQNIV